MKKYIFTFSSEKDFRKTVNPLATSALQHIEASQLICRANKLTSF